MADQKWYDEGIRPKIFINWQSFEDWGIPSNWKGPFTDAVINTYTRWMNLAGVDLRFQLWNYTTKTSADSGELLIKMNEKHGSRLASTFGGYGRLEIVFHRKRGTDLTPWDFVPYNANPGEFDMQCILMHELGHCFGLDHSTNTNDTMFQSYEYHRMRFGPFDNDVARVRNVYSDFKKNRLLQLKTTNGGVTWSVASNNLTYHNNDHARTNVNPGVVECPNSGLYVVGWSMLSRSPTWLRGDGANFLMQHWYHYGGERSIYGPAYAHDDESNILWAWVDNDDLGAIKIVRSTNQGYQWHWVKTPSDATTYGTPGLCWTRIGGQSTWILVWSHFDRTNHNDTGYMRASISTNDGASWSTPIVLNDFYKTLSGVSIAADDKNHILVAFAWAPNNTVGVNKIRSFQCQVNGGQLQRVAFMYGNETTRIQPALAYDANVDKFIMAWRAQNFNTTLNSISKTPSATGWSGKTILSGNHSHVAPALAYSQEHKETVMWYAHENV